MIECLCVEVGGGWAKQAGRRQTEADRGSHGLLLQQQAGSDENNEEKPNKKRKLEKIGEREE